MSGAVAIMAARQFAWASQLTCVGEWMIEKERERERESESEWYVIWIQSLNQHHLNQSSLAHNYGPVSQYTYTFTKRSVKHTHPVLLYNSIHVRSLHYTLGSLFDIIHTVRKSIQKTIIIITENDQTNGHDHDHHYHHQGKIKLSRSQKHPLLVLWWGVFIYFLLLLISSWSMKDYDEFEANEFMILLKL